MSAAALTIVACALALLALLGAVAAIKAHHRHKIALAKWKRRAERVHAYHEAMRRLRA